MSLETPTLNSDSVADKEIAEQLLKCWEDYQIFESFDSHEAAKCVERLTIQIHQLKDKQNTFSIFHHLQEIAQKKGMDAEDTVFEIKSWASDLLNSESCYTYPTYYGLLEERIALIGIPLLDPKEELSTITDWPTIFIDSGMAPPDSRFHFLGYLDHSKTFELSTDLDAQRQFREEFTKISEPQNYYPSLQKYFKNPNEWHVDPTSSRPRVAIFVVQSRAAVDDKDPISIIAYDWLVEGKLPESISMAWESCIKKELEKSLLEIKLPLSYLRPFPLFSAALEALHWHIRQSFQYSYQTKYFDRNIPDFSSFQVAYCSENKENLFSATFMDGIQLNVIYEPLPLCIMKILAESFNTELHDLRPRTL